MTNFNDCRKKYFKNQQTTYSEPKHWLDYEQAALAEALEKELPINILDTWREYFKEYGYTEEDGTNLTDLWYKFLGDNGFTQRGLRSRLKAFYCSESIDLPLIPNKEEIIQWLDKVYQADDSCYYIEDKRGDQLRPVHGGGYGAFDGSTNSISFTDLSGVTITSYDGTGIPTIATNDINVTAGTISYLELSNGGIYDFEEQSGTTLLDKSGNDNHGTISGTMTNFWDSSETVKSYKNINGYNVALASDGVDDYIDTGIVPDENTKVEIKLIINSLPVYTGSNAFEQFFGARTNVATADFFLGLKTDSTKTTFHSEFFDKNLDSSLLATTEKVYNLSLSKDGVYIEGEKIIDFSGYSVVTITHNIFLFALSSFGTTSDCSSITVFDFKIWQSGILVRHFTPQEDGTFLDIVNDVVYSNDGTGDLDVSYIPRLETAENTLLPITEQTDILGLPLENYGRARNDVKIVNTSALALNGTDNYIDTGIIPENNADFYIEAECNFVDSSSQFMGARGNGVDIQPYFYFGTTSSSEQYIFIYGNGASLPVGDFDGESHKFKMTGDGKCYFDDVYKGQMSGDIAGLLNEIWIGGTNSNGVSSSFTDAEINYFKIGNSTGLIRHYVFGEGEGSVVYDKVTGEAFDINGTLDDVWTHNDCARPHNLLDGFSAGLISDGTTDYIDTGIFPDRDTKIEVIADIPDTSGDFLFGANDGAGHRYYIGVTSSNFGLGFEDSNYLDASTPYEEGTHTFVIDDGKMYIDNVMVDDKNSETFTGTSTAPILIGGLPSYLSQSTFFSVKIWQSGLLVQHLVPQVDSSFLDLVSGDTFRSEGEGLKVIRIPANEAGDLDVFGNELTNPGTEVGSNGSENKFEQPDSYEIYEVPLSLESDGVGDYIDTGIKPNQDLFLDIKFKINILPTGSIDDFLLGSSQSSYGNPKFYLMVDSVTKRFGLRYGTAAFDSNIVANTTDIYDIRFEDKKWYINDNLIHDFTGEADFQTNYNTILLANNTAGTAERFTPMTVFKVRLNDNWYVPIKLGDTMGTQTATANGLYDKINDTITYNGGTGEMPIYNGLMTYGYEDMQADYNDAHYWFNDVFSQDPIRFKTLMYSAQQEGVLLTKALKYTKSYLTKYIPSTFFEAEMIYK